MSLKYLNQNNETQVVRATNSETKDILQLKDDLSCLRKGFNRIQMGIVHVKRLGTRFPAKTYMFRKKQK